LAKGCFSDRSIATGNSVKKETDNKSQLFKRLCIIGLFTSLGGTISLILSSITGSGITEAVILGAVLLISLCFGCASCYYLNRKGYLRLAHKFLVYSTLLVVSIAYFGFGTDLPLMVAFMLPITLAVVLMETWEAIGVILLSVAESVTLYLAQRAFSLYIPVTTLDEVGKIVAGITIALVIIPSVSALLLIPTLERKLAEEAMVKSERKYRSAVETIQEVIFQTDEFGRFTYLNPAWTVITGHDVKQSQGQDIFNFIYPEDKQKFAILFTPILEGKETALHHTLRILREDGMVRWVELLASLTQEGDEINGIAGTLNDITIRVQGEHLERDRSQILEMVAASQPLEAILGQIVIMVKYQQPGLNCNILLKEVPNEHLPILNDPASRKLYQNNNEEWITQPKIENDFEIKKGHLETSRARTYLPILSRKEIRLGTLVVENVGNNGQPSAHEMALFEMARQLAAIAIEQNQLSNLLLYQARHDRLTGLPNRSYFEEVLHTTLEQQSQNMAAVLFVDLDRFKFINDTLGHQVGDGLLKQVAKRLDNSVRLSDTVARRGGDEFTAIITNIKSGEDAKIVAQNFLQVFTEPFTVDEHELFISPSIGISIYPEDGVTVTELERKADSAMYYAKERGRNNFQFFNHELNQKGSRRLKLEGQLRRALERNEFILYYQPKIDIINGEYKGFEALIRWKQPEEGLISPAEFIPLAEETGLINPIGRWVLQEACRQLKTWHKKGFDELTVAVNVSALQFEQADFVETVARALKESTLEARYLELELSESLLVRDISGITRKLEKLKQLGVRIAMDDFGTGYSSLSYLQKLPIDILKIDQSFVRVIQQQSDGKDNRVTEGAIAKTITVLGHSLGMHVIAEGVETLTQMEFLKEAGCDEVQGYLISHPLPPDKLEMFLENSQTFFSDLSYVSS